MTWVFMFQKIIKYYVYLSNYLNKMKQKRKQLEDAI